MGKKLGGYAYEDGVNYKIIVKDMGIQNFKCVPESESLWYNSIVRDINPNKVQGVLES